MQRSDATTVLSAFDQDSWDRSGVSWLASLRDLAKYTGDVCVVADGLNDRASRFLKAHGARLVQPAGRFHSPRLDHYYTAILAGGPVSAYWENTCYFQDDLSDLFAQASGKIVASLSLSPLPMLRPSLGCFGYEDSDCYSSRPMHATLLDIARTHGTVLDGQFIAGPKEHLHFYAKLLEFHATYGYIHDTPHAVDLCLNLLYSADPDVVEVDSRWHELVDGQWAWRSGFYKGDKLIKVVSFPPALTFTASCARFHLVNCYRELFAAWQAKYRDQFTMPRLLFSRIKKEPSGENKTVQVLPGP